jgi:uncharacterized repeat protein (TIGR03803 family)
VTKTGDETVLHSFWGEDGENPRAGLVLDAQGTFYGTTDGGGASDVGTVFKLTKTGKETVLHSFCTKMNCVDGLGAVAGLTMDVTGNLYGTTPGGGAHLGGTVFEMGRGKETVLYSFCPVSGCADGAEPLADLVMDAKGNLYGTALGGTSGNGVVFKVDKAGKETVLHSFTGGSDGGTPLAGLVKDAKGNLYGTASKGGTSGYGVVFKLTLNSR